MGARVILRRNIHMDGGWVNDTLAVVTSLHPSCIVIAKLANPAHKYPVPTFRQRIEIQGASYVRNSLCSWHMVLQCTVFMVVLFNRQYCAWVRSFLQACVALSSLVL